MAVFRKRLIFWLIKAYVRRWWKVIIFSFFLGLFIFFGLVAGAKYLTRFIPIEKKVRIGVIGAYTADNLPSFVIDNLSHGLTKVADNGTIQPDVAAKWDIQEGGKKYIFHLKKNLSFSDNTPVTSDGISYRFANVKITKPDPYTIAFQLKDVYSPFLVTVSRPIFKKGYIGVGEYKLSGIHLNGNFVESLDITSTKNKLFSESYVFYPSEEAVKHAFALGEITQAEGLTSDSYMDTSFDKFPNVTVNKHIDYNRLVAVFFNTQDPFLSDKRIRSALTYALPDSFPGGQRTVVPYPPQSIYLNQSVIDRKQDMAHAKLLFDAATTGASASAIPTIQIETATRYHDVAQELSNTWKQLGLKTTIDDAESIPANFRIYLGDFTLPKDPDQYVLWHSTSNDNITKINSPRLDLLLEEGRKTTDIDSRVKTYNEFQKYLLDESPAAFLYFPYDYIITRK